MTRFDLGSGNPLIRRVRRHQAVSTLFRRASQSSLPRPTPPDPTSTPGIECEPPVEIVQAEMVSVRGTETRESSEPETSEPAAERPLTGPPRHATPSATQPARPIARSARQTKISAQAEPPTPEPPEAIDATSPPEPDAEESIITETVWQRLKTIVQRHQAPTDEPAREPGGEPVNEDAPPTHGPEQPEEAAEAPTSTDSQPTPVVPSTRSEPAAVQRQTTADEGETAAEGKGVEDASDIEPRSQPAPPTLTASEAPSPEEIRRQPQLESGTVVGKIDPPSMSQEQQPEGDQVEPQAKGLARPGAELTEVSTSPEDDTARLPTDVSPLSSEEEARADRQQVAGIPVERETIPTEGTIPPEDATDARKPEPAPTPLQEVWDVQTTRQHPVKTQRPESASEPRREMGRDVDRGERLVRRQAPPSEAGIAPQVQQLMRQAIAGRPTRSSIEVIQPRRPRPSAPPVRPDLPGEAERLPTEEAKRGAREVTPEIEPESGSQPAVQARRTKLEPGEKPMMRTSEPQTPPYERASLPQGTPVDAPSSWEDQPMMVQTAIGPLPGDLWELIGEPVPSAGEPAEGSREKAREITIETQRPRSQRQGQSPDTKPVAERPMRVEAAKAPLKPPTSPPDATSPEHLTIPPATTVQRAEAATDGAMEAQPETEETTDGSLDVDELARRVYGEVRRRLAVELERMRSYF